MRFRKKLGLELGGNAPMIVLKSADLDTAVRAAMASKYRIWWADLSCADRFLVHERRRRVVEKLAAEASALKLGHGLDAGTGIGPLIDEAATFKCQERVKGAGWARSGLRRHQLAGPGSFFEPTVVKNVAIDSELWQLETFGPVAGIASFSDDAEAVRLANEGPAGLAAYVCGELGHAWAVAERLDFGIVSAAASE